jgi:hypothetical protein
MDQDDQSQLHPPQILGYLYQDYVPGAISPCTTHVDSSGEEVPSLFHLLSCGHIVAANDCDQRCGRNCQHAVATTSSPSLPGATGSKAYVKHNLAKSITNTAQTEGNQQQPASTQHNSGHRRTILRDMLGHPRRSLQTHEPERASQQNPPCFSSYTISTSLHPRLP